MLGYGAGYTPLFLCAKLEKSIDIIPKRVCNIKHREEEKRKIKILPLCRNIGEVIVLNGVIFLLKGLWSGFSEHWFVCAMIAWLIIAGLDVWYIGKSNCYRNQ